MIAFINNHTRKIITLFVILFSWIVFSDCTCNPSDKKEKLNVIILAGQSNMIGSGFVAELDESYKVLPSNVILYKHTVWKKFDTLDGVIFGPEISLSHKISRKFPDKKFLIIKFAVAGTSIANWCKKKIPNTAEDGGNYEYNSFFEQFVDFVKTNIKKKDARIIALCWLQGETDSRTRKDALSYYKYFKKFILEFRREMDAPNLPVICSLVNPPSNEYPFVEKVQSAQIDLSKELQNVIAISPDGLPKHPDGVHYSSEGQLLIGLRFEEQISLLLK